MKPTLPGVRESETEASMRTTSQRVAAPVSVAEDDENPEAPFRSENGYAALADISSHINSKDFWQNGLVNPTELRRPKSGPARGAGSSGGAMPTSALAATATTSADRWAEPAPARAPSAPPTRDPPASQRAASAPRSGRPGTPSGAFGPAPAALVEAAPPT